MKDMEEREVKKVRLRLLDLLKSFFVEEPDAEKMSRWRGTFRALVKEQVNPAFDQGAHDILDFLQTKSLEELQEEYYKLFTDPFTDKGLQTTASFYLDGRPQGKSLVDLRSLLMEIGLAKQEGTKETEDSLVVMLDIYSRLIEEDGFSQKLQEELLQKYLVPFSTKLSQACGENQFADFYRGCCAFLCGYLDMEKELTGSVVYQ